MARFVSSKSRHITPQVGSRSRPCMSQKKGPGIQNPYNQSRITEGSQTPCTARCVPERHGSAARDNTRAASPGGAQTRDCCLLSTARPVHKSLDPYHWQRFDFFFPDVAQYTVGALQVLVEAFLVGGEGVRLVRGCRRHGWVSHGSPQQRTSCL